MSASLSRFLAGAAVIVRDADPTDWTADERDDVLVALGPVAVEIVGLSARIRAAKVNGTEVPRPDPKRVDPQDQPKTDPPPEDPPPKPGEGR